MQQLESRHKSELANHFRAQEKELEHLRITYERELDRLRSRNRAELEQGVGVSRELMMYTQYKYMYLVTIEVTILIGGLAPLLFSWRVYYTCGRDIWLL